MAFYH